MSAPLPDPPPASRGEGKEGGSGPPTTDHRPPTTDHRPPTTDHRPPTTDHRPHDSYRRDVDGLRAVAVLAVVAFHVGIAGVGGGFVGVDIFFVISGYLITGLLLREASRDGTIALAEFYARRIRRLFPALAVVVMATLIAAQFLLLPIGEQPALARSVTMTALYLSNLHFQRQANDYFAGAAEEQPLLHTWSLAVEEQYYLVWPAVVMVCCWLARRAGLRIRPTLTVVLAGITAVSLALCVQWSARSPGAAFYHLPARAWELGLGALLSLVLSDATRRPRIGDALTVVGLVAIAAAVALIDGTMAFPGVVAALPVLGAVACIAGGGLGSSVATLTLGSRPMVFVGKLSYSWYLWHWPLLAIARARGMGQLPPSIAALLAVAALLLAWGTLVWVEDPIRYGKPWPFAGRRSTIVAGLAISMALCGTALLSRMVAGRAAQQPSFAELRAVERDRPLLPGCQTSRVPLPARDRCTIAGQAGREIVVWGDSHASRIVPAVAAAAAAAKVAVVQRTNPACPPLLGVIPSDRRPNRGCSRFNRAVLDEIAGQRAAGTSITVVLVGRWTNYLDAISPTGAPTRTLFPADLARDDRSPAQLLEAGLAATATALRGLGAEVVLVETVPELAASAPECRARRGREACVISRTSAQHYRTTASQIVQRVAAGHPGIAVVDPFEAFCDGQTCRPELEGHLAYADAHHLTYSGGARLAWQFVPILAPSTGPSH